MRFNYNLNVDFSQWRTVKMERENNMRDFKIMDDEIPKFGAGSEYNRDQKEEARRKKFGIIAKKYNPENQVILNELCKIAGRITRTFFTFSRGS